MVQVSTVYAIDLFRRHELQHIVGPNFLLDTTWRRYWTLDASCWKLSKIASLQALIGERGGTVDSNLWSEGRHSRSTSPVSSTTIKKEQNEENYSTVPPFFEYCKALCIELHRHAWAKGLVGLSNLKRFLHSGLNSINSREWLIWSSKRFRPLSSTLECFGTSQKSTLNTDNIKNPRKRLKRFRNGLRSFLVSFRTRK